MIQIPKVYRTEKYLNIANFWPLSEVVGPGKRAIIWLQGCLKRCKECITPEMQPIESKMWIKVETISKFIASIKNIEGITIYGGEPILQFMALSHLFENLKKSGLTTMLYTGYYYEELLNYPHPLMKNLLNNTDILVDGPYIPELDHGEMWRGSSNQRIIFLSEIYKDWEWVINEKKREIEIRISKNGKFVILGIPPKNLYPILFTNWKGGIKNAKE